MNREIKFRIWDTDGKKFWNGPFNDRLNEIFDKKRFEFCQFTGLKDKNGKDIYEGDILKNEGHFRCGTVKFEEAKFIVKIDSRIYSYDLYELFDGLFQKDYPEIIGNIFENPDLLK